MAAVALLGEDADVGVEAADKVGVHGLPSTSADN